jgi:DNA-binding protein H-NS
MDVAQLSHHIAGLRVALAAKINEQRAYFERELAGLSGYTNGGRALPSSGARVGRPGAGKRAKAKPKYQSKKNASVKWSGRGMTPVWMREEMKGTKLKKENFLIK